MQRVDTCGEESKGYVGRYRIRGVLGEGGMGRLFVGEQVGIEGFAKIVAIKRILPHLENNPHFKNLFLAEARTAARLVHPNIVSTFELGQSDDSYFMAMEYLAGEDLSAVLERCRGRHPMPVEIAAAVAQHSALGLHYAHELRNAEGHRSGIVHRDVNPSNIFVTYHGAIKLLDFGVVKGAAGDEDSNPGVFKGKYAYCAPEQIESQTIDRRTDVFCLGIVLWECLTGQRLWNTSSDDITQAEICSRDALAPSVVRPEVPHELDLITVKALARRPEDRFATAQDMAEAIDAFFSRRVQRPTALAIGRWVESLFGAERPALKRAIAAGRDVEFALARLAALEEAEVPRDQELTAGRGMSDVRPRPLWVMDIGAVPTAELRPTPVRASAAALAQAYTPASQPVISTRISEGVSTFGSPRATGAPFEVIPTRLREGSRGVGVRSRFGSPAALRTWVAIGAALGTLGLAVIGVRAGGEPPQSVYAAAPISVGSARIESDPPGAHVFVDGDPSGLTTPAVLPGLRVGREIQIRLDKPGYQPAVRRIEVGNGTMTVHRVHLDEASGVVKLVGAGRNVRVYVNDIPYDAHQPLVLAIGEHSLRVEQGDDILTAQTIFVRPGQQVVHVPAGRRSQ